MKKTYFVILLLSFPLLSGCAAGSATAGYSLKAGSSDELSTRARQEIVNESVDKAYEKSKAYVDENFVKKEKK